MARKIDTIKKDIVGEVFSPIELENYMHNYDFVIVESDEYENAKNVIKFTNYKSQIWVECEIDEENNILILNLKSISKINNERTKNISYMKIVDTEKYHYINIKIPDTTKELTRIYPKYPFVPQDEKTKEIRCKEIINIQASALARRLLKLRNSKCIIGISGGLDSTLAFLVIVKAFEKLNRNTKDIIAVTMPGFGTTGRTYNNAIKLIKEYKATLKEVNIKESCLLHMKDISLPLTDRSTTYENIQARERTQILMDIANMENGIVIGTGDLSELALGWCTYNGDHMSMYAVNISIPKTLVQYLVGYLKDQEDLKKQQVILDILDTPISPELLPPDSNGNILQETESSIGPYVLHDFFLYHFLRYGASPKKIYFLAKKTFQNNFSNEEIKKWLTLFFKRFFTQQFKRNCLPDGIKVGTISLSPRGDFRMPSDIDYEVIPNLASEARQKLEKIRPKTMGQASRISGVNPSDLAILSVYLKKKYNK